MASVPDSASVPLAERERGIEKTDELRRLKNARNRQFESISLQRGVDCEPNSGAHQKPLGSLVFARALSCWWVAGLPGAGG